MTTRIIGIDPGLLHTGWAIVESSGNSWKYIASGVICPNAKDSLPVRLAHIFKGVNEICERFAPDVASVEITFVNKNPTSTLLLGHARAAAIVAIGTHDIPVFEYEPTKIKQAITGFGRADKDQIHKMIKILLPAANPKSPDESDAIAIALSHVQCVKCKV